MRTAWGAWWVCRLRLVGFKYIKEVSFVRVKGFWRKFLEGGWHPLDVAGY
jgi:hypothetical protein